MDNKNLSYSTMNVSYFKINYINIFLFLAFIVFFFVIFYKLYDNIHSKLNNTSGTTSNEQPTSIFGDWYSSFIERLIREQLDKKTLPINDKIREKTELIKNNTAKLTTVEDNIIDKNIDNNVKFQNEFIKTKMNMEFIKNTIEKINATYSNNVDKMEDIYDYYSNRFQDYVGNVSKILRILQYQLNLAYVTPTLGVVIHPIKNLYENIYDTLKTNASFIQKYVQNFDIDKIKPLEIKVDGVKTLNSEFDKSTEIFNKIGY